MRIDSCSAVLLLGLTLGCAHGKNEFTAQSFHQGRYNFDVAYQDEAAKRVLPEDWRIDNYYNQPGDDTLRPKSVEWYQTNYAFDRDGDGQYETKETLSTYDLRFENRNSAGVIWLRSIPLDQTDRDKDLMVMMRSAVDSVAGGEYVYWKVGDRVFSTSEHLVAQQLDEARATVAGREAYVSTIELANADQLKLNDKRRLRRIRMVMIRSGLNHELGWSYNKVNFPVIIVAGLSDLPEYFERDLPAFEQFVGQITIGGAKGFKVSPATNVSPVSAPETPVNANTNLNAPPTSEPAPNPNPPESIPNTNTLPAP